MIKKIFLIIVILLIIGIAGYWFYHSKTPSENNGKIVVFDPKNAAYMIEGDSIVLVNGRAEKEIAPGSASKIEVMAWGEPAAGDLNSDQANDAALILTYSAGGSGTFYYVAVALRDAESGKAMGTNSFLLGDRIAPQNITIDKGIIVVNYADRKSGEPMTTRPSIGITRTFNIQGAVLVETTPESAKKEQACAISGGSIQASLCCQSVGDFPDSCLVGSCGCSLESSHEVKACDCGPGKCFDGKKCLSTKEITFCTEKDRTADVCFDLYDPVCAKVNIQCIKAPCDPVYQTFSNPCEACKNLLVELYTRGECLITE